MKRAEETLLKRDVDADEIITPGELIRGLGDEGAIATQLWPPEVREEELPPLLRRMPVRWHRWSASAKKTPPGASEDKPARRERIDLSDSRPGTSMRIDGGRVVLSLRSSAGRLSEQTERAADHWTHRFEAADADGDGRIDEAETAEKEQADARWLLRAADRNADGSATRAELESWLTLQKKLAEGIVLIGIIDRGRGLFDQFDANGDGRLSLRELRAAQVHLATGKERLTPDDVPRRLLVTLSRGRPRSPSPVSLPAAPDWLRAMDRNRDGDISPREFLGTGADFQRLDQDRDGLVTAAEAETI